MKQPRAQTSQSALVSAKMQIRSMGFKPVTRSPLPKLLAISSIWKKNKKTWKIMKYPDASNDSLEFFSIIKNSFFKTLNVYCHDNKYITAFLSTFLPFFGQHPYVSMFLVLKISKNCHFLPSAYVRNTWTVPKKKEPQPSH